MTIDDILEENARMRAEIKWLNDVITNNISELAAQVAANQLSIEVLTLSFAAPLISLSAF